VCRGVDGIDYLDGDNLVCGSGGMRVTGTV